MLERNCWLQTLLLALLVTVSTAASPKDLAGDAEKYLLPGNVVPVLYSLTITPNIENFVGGQEDTFYFNGSIGISILPLEDNITEVVLHTYEIEIQLVLMQSQVNPVEVFVTVGKYDNETDKQILHVSPPLRKDEMYLLIIAYKGRNTNDLTGFYRSSYYQGLQRRWLLVTDFESFGARRAFPCFDEPKYKAYFQLSTILSKNLTDDGYVSHFNTEIDSVYEAPSWTMTTFKTTALPISTYLVAFLISDFQESPEPAFFNSSYKGENETKPFRTVGRPSFFEPRQDLLSQVTGPAVLEYMTAKTRIGFGFTKVNQAGIPDFAAGAMENWGLVTYRESLVFWDEEEGSTNQKQSVVTVIAHELGHQWFGDLVTLHWWSDLWLNEGFATFYEYHAADQIREPTLDTSSWDLIGQFVVDVIQSTAFAVDSISDSRPLTFEAYDQMSIDSFFDSISYQKGGSVLRMWSHVLGEDIFYNGLNYYLTENAEGTGTPESLLENFDRAVNESSTKLPLSVPDLLKPWHLQPGYPAITAQRNQGQLILTQERYLWDEGENLEWNVPISYSTNLEDNFNDTRPTDFLLQNSDSLKLSLKDPAAKWVVLNNQATGYYRINYDDDNWDALIEELKDPDTIIHEYNRAQIYDDLSNFSGFLKKNPPHYEKLLRLLFALKHERSFVVWKSGLSIMNFLLSQLSSHPETYSLLKGYLSVIVGPVFQELQLNVKHDEPHTRKLLRVAVAKMACRLEIDSCRIQAEIESKKISIPADSREVVLCELMRHADDEAWKSTLDKALELDSSMRTHLLSSLLCASDNLDRLFNILRDDDRLSAADKYNIVSAAAFASDNNQALFALKVLSQQKKLKTTTQSSQMLTKLAVSLNSEEAEELMKPISATHSKIIKLNREWLQKKQPEILEWLENHTMN